MLATRSVAIVDTNLLASSLQEGWPALAAGAPAAPNAYFHVEAGIAIRDLYQLLDHQKPRLALGSSGGSPGATLAGAISTGTHGGEFSTPLLVDTVRAIHLVGPGGVQWWIEGSSPIANPQALM
jgi:FAD/FMN-containing dehydrogenase